jgi:mono/diheme cytochrome c family protein
MVTDDPVGESFWKVKNGIRLSGMPGFKDVLSETEMWQVSALLAKAEQLPAEVSTKLKSKDAADLPLSNLKSQIPNSK